MFFVSLLIGTILVLVAIAIHYEVLRIAAAYLLPRIHIVSRRAHVMLGVLACMAAHTAEIWIFALAYWLLSQTGIAVAFSDHYQRDFSDYLNFSAESYTSLGFGDVKMLTPDMRRLAGIEALTGLVLIAWSASFTYYLMAQYWRGISRD